VLCDIYIQLKMTKRSAGTPPVDNSDKEKRKHLCLFIAQKDELLQELDLGVSFRRLTEEYGVRTTTACDLKKLMPCLV
jgi:hypothetical protein